MVTGGLEVGMQYDAVAVAATLGLAFGQPVSESALFVGRGPGFAEEVAPSVHAGGDRPSFGSMQRLVERGLPRRALRHPESVGGAKLENYMATSMLNAAITVAGCPAAAVPCGFDRHGRPVGLQIAAPPRREERALAAAALFEGLTGLDRMVPIEPREGTVPPVEA